MSGRGNRLLNLALLVAILGGLAWLVRTIGTRPSPGERPPAPAAPVAATRPPATPSPLEPAPGAALLVPVAGIRPEQLVDTFTDARGNGRPHDAIDIMAPRGTPVVAAAEGVIEKLYFSPGGGGITVYVRSPDGRWLYYYAHLDRYAPDLAEGQQVQRGTALGFVGSTGNASPDGPHLHFAVNEMAPGERWWQGRPINPYPLLSAIRR